MNRRQLLASLGAAVAAAGTVSAVVAQEGKGAKAGTRHRHGDACAKACVDCVVSCESCRKHCEDEVVSGKKDFVETMRLCADCADCCGACGAICARDGVLMAVICKACAECCDACAEACGKFSDDAHMKACAEACRKCASECREMAKHAD